MPIALHIATYSSYTMFLGSFSFISVNAISLLLLCLGYQTLSLLACNEA